MLFGSVPPPGWTLVTDFHDRVLRIVNNTTNVGLTGGGWTITGLSLGNAGSHSHTVTINAAGNHSHTVTISSILQDSPNEWSDTYFGKPGTYTTSTSGSHSHTASVSTNGSHIHSLSSDASWRPAYINIVMAEKA